MVVKKDYKIISLIICDDTIAAISGKETLIGVYNSVAVVDNFPYRFNRLVFRTIAELNYEEPSGFVFALEEAGTGKVILDHSGKVSQKEPDDDAPYLFGIITEQLMIEHPMTLRVRLGIDRDPETIGKLIIRRPINDQERRRIL